jgi:hypothetical protein
LTFAPTATRTRDLPLRRSYRGRWQTAAFLVSRGLHGAWHPVSVSGFCLVRARDGYGTPPGRRPSPYHVDSGSRLSCCDAGQSRFHYRLGAGQCLRFSPRSGTRLAREDGTRKGGASTPSGDTPPFKLLTGLEPVPTALCAVEGGSPKTVALQYCPA